MPGAPEQYSGNSSYTDPISAALSAREIPHVFSDDAGGYVCNHTFFLRLATKSRRSGLAVPCGFIHVPRINTPEEFAMLLEAMKICIGTALPSI